MEQSNQPENIMACVFHLAIAPDLTNIVEPLRTIPHTKSQADNGYTRYEARVDLSDTRQVQNGIRLLYGIENVKQAELSIKGKHIPRAVAISVLECYLNKLMAPNRTRSSYCRDRFTNLRVTQGQSYGLGTRIRTDRITLPCKQIEDFAYGLEWWRFGKLFENIWTIDKAEISKRLKELTENSSCGWCPGFEGKLLELALAELPNTILPEKDTAWDWFQPLDGSPAIIPTFPIKVVNDNQLSSESSEETDEEVFPKSNDRPADDEKHMDAEKPHASFDLIGGLGPVIKQLRDVFELPLKRPETFIALGITPPKSALLVGPPGTGKTLLARALASEISAHFIARAATELIGSYVGETEENIRDLFAEAKRQKPAIIFIDEIDAIATDRARAERSYEVTPLNQLLVLMDGFNALDGVGLLFATNRLEVLDPAFYRPGRIDKVITVPPPTIDGRYEILQIYTKKMPLSPNVSLQSLAEVTTNLTGAELKALVQEAGITAIRRADFIEKEAHSTEKPKIVVTSDDFAQALTRIMTTRQ